MLQKKKSQLAKISLDGMDDSATGRLDVREASLFRTVDTDNYCRT
jgi:hypothetical protein